MHQCSLALVRGLIPLGLAMSCALAAAAGAPSLGSDLRGLLDYARAHNPELRVRGLEAEAARERIESAGALPDPTFQVELMDFTNTANGRDPSLLPGETGATRYRVVQPLPFWGKRALRSGLARAQAEQLGLARESRALDIEARVKTAFANYYGALGRELIQRETLALLEALEQLVLTRYAVGLVPQQDALRVQGEITGLKVDLVDTARQQRETRARLNAALPRAPDAALAEPGALPPLPADVNFAALVQRARERSPALAELRAGIGASAAERELAYRERYPDFALGLTNNRPRSGTDNWDLMVEVNIPLQQSRRRSEERSAERLFEGARARLAAAEAELDGELAGEVAAFESATERAALLRRTLLPQSQATLEAAEAGYETGRVNFDTLIEAERQILRTRLALLESEVEAQLRLAEMERLVGEDL